METLRNDILGDNVLIQLSYIVGIIIISVVLRLLIHPLLKKTATKTEETKTPWINETTVWINRMILRIIVLSLFWTASYTFDNINEDTAEIQRQQVAAQLQKLNLEKRSGQVVLRQQDRSVTPEDIEAKRYSLIRVLPVCRCYGYCTERYPNIYTKRPISSCYLP